jgi:predicted Zn-dependent peptidase
MASSVTGGARIILVDRPGTTQSLVYLAEPAVARDDPRREPLQLASAILGGFWMSRINANLREKRGWSYWVSSEMPARRGPAPIRAGGAITLDKTGPAVVELLDEVRRMTEQEVSGEELRGAKLFLLRRTYGQLEASSDLGLAVADLVTYGRPLDEYATLPARLESITAQDVLDAARRYLHPDTIKLFVVGDRIKVEEQLRQLGLGDVEIRDAYGDVVAK